jgi:hypothetical protein
MVPRKSGTTVRPLKSVELICFVGVPVTLTVGGWLSLVDEVTSCIRLV